MEKLVFELWDFEFRFSRIYVTIVDLTFFLSHYHIVKIDKSMKHSVLRTSLSVFSKKLNKW